MKRTFVLSTVLLAISFGALAQGAASVVHRDAHQQHRIAQGLRSGSLSVGEAARLQRQQAHVDRLEADALKDGRLDALERNRLARAQDRASRDLHAAKHNAVTGDPHSVASQRAAADAARQAHQERRIESGVRHGTLTDREVAHLERGQARVSRAEAATARDGHIDGREQARLDRLQDRQSRRIHNQSHDLHHRG